jgi:putative holliday junction resolvase
MIQAESAINYIAEGPAPSAQLMARWQRFLAFDYGSARTGVASGNRLLRQATPQRSVQAKGDARWPLIAQALAQWQPDALVVGVPWHPDGAAHDNTRAAQRFARQLQGRFGLPVMCVDERYSTTEALALQREGHLAGPHARDTDSAAACIILEQFLRSLP